MSYLSIQRLVRRVFAQRIDQLSAVVHQQERANNLFPFLLFARIFPMSPNFLLNLSSPLVGVPFHLFFFSVFFGKDSLFFFLPDVYKLLLLIRLLTIIIIMIRFDAIQLRVCSGRHHLESAQQLQ